MKSTPENTIIKKVNRAVYDSMRVLIKQIAQDHNLDPEDLISTYLPNIESDTKCKRTRKDKKDEYIETEEYYFKGRTYLVDANDVVYSNNINKPTILGKRLQDGVIQFATTVHQSR